MVKNEISTRDAGFLLKGKMTSKSKSWFSYTQSSYSVHFFLHFPWFTQPSLYCFFRLFGISTHGGAYRYHSWWDCVGLMWYWEPTHVICRPCKHHTYFTVSLYCLSEDHADWFCSPCLSMNNCKLSGLFYMSHLELLILWNTLVLMALLHKYS